ncbi:GspH/FimT family pseudopilin [Pseudomonas gingeri]
MKYRPQVEQGFTLLEMLVVIVIIAIGFSVLTYGVSKGLANTRDRQAKTDLTIALRTVRNQAIFSGQTVLLHFDLARNSYQVPGQAQHLLPDGMQMHLTTAANLSPQEGAIAFYPNGSSSGGNILLEKGKRTSRIDIAWLTGKVSWTDVEQP